MPGVLLPKMFAAAGGADFAPGDDDDVVAQTLDHIELVRGEQHRHPRRRPAVQDIGDDIDRERVKAREGFVEDEHVGFVYERRRDLRPLLVTQRELLDGVIQALAESELFEESRRPGLSLVLVEAVQASEVRDVLVDLHLRIQPTLFGHVPEAAPVRRGQRRAIEGDRPLILGEHPQDDAHRRGLPRAVSADKARQAAGPDGERQIVQNAVRAITLGHMRQLEHAAPLTRFSQVRNDAGFAASAPGRVLRIPLVGESFAQARPWRYA